MDTITQENIVLSQNESVLQELPKDNQSKNNFLVVLLSILLALSVLIAGFFAYQTQKLVNELNSLKNGKEVITETTEASTIDSTSDWKTYSNTKHGFMLKYPSNWKLEKLNDTDEFNANPRFVNGNSIIQVYANMDGLGGSGTTYTGTPIVVSGLNLYKYESENTYGKTMQVGITDELSHSLGVFKHLNKSYAIFLTYSDNTSAEDANVLKSEFDQILSTFKFTDTTQIAEETDVRSFADLYAKTFMSGDWTKLKTLLTSTASKEMSAGISNLPIGGYSFDSYKILAVSKDPTAVNYTAVIQFTKDGKPYRNPTGDPKIIITKENGEWKSISWYLYQ